MVGAACGGSRAIPAATAPGEGIAITVYQAGERSYGVIDDRRVVEVARGTFLLDRIDGAAPLQALVIEPLGGAGALRVTACARENLEAGSGVEAGLPSPLVRCKVVARDGKHAVRILQVAPTFTFHARHEVVIDAIDGEVAGESARAQVTTRYAFATPAWRGKPATLALYEGLPGAAAAPRLLATTSAILDGSTSIVAAPPRELAAKLLTVYRGIQQGDEDDIEATDVVWGRASHHRVWRWLELRDTVLAAGAVHARAFGRELAIEAASIERDEAATRIPLWVDEDLLGTRTRTIDRADGVTITDRVELAVANLGDGAREVWLEERMRSAKPRRIVPDRRLALQHVNEVVRTKLTIAPGKTERLVFTIEYAFRE
jgi:hypothetical protein